MTTCAVCGLQFDEIDANTCAALCIPRARSVLNGFLLYDTVADKDVPDLDVCERRDCPGYHPEFEFVGPVLPSVVYSWLDLGPDDGCPF